VKVWLLQAFRSGENTNSLRTAQNRMETMKRPIYYLASLFIGIGLLTGCNRELEPIGSASNPIKFFFVPSVDAQVIGEKTKALKEYLEAKTPYKYKIQIPTSYVAVVEAFGTERADIASLNTFGYILAHEKYQAEALITVERYGHTDYKGQIVAKAKSAITNLNDIAGKKMAYVDPASTSGYLLPAKMLKEKNIKPSEIVFAQKHDNVISMVYQGQVDVGASFYSPPEKGVIQDARRLVKTQFPDVEEKIKIVQLTDSIPNDPIAFRKNLPDEVKKSVVDALISFVETEEGKKTFHEIYGVTGLKKASDKSYDGVRKMLAALGKSATQLIKKD
jgi:phosphonate transport system substrate-binding protein